MRKTKAVLAFLAGLALVIPGGAAQADDRTDVGNGRAACSNGELCFQLSWDNFSTSAYQRHFWWSDGNHVDNYWHNVWPPESTTFSIRDSIEGVWNRDTECALWLRDITSSGSWVYYSVTTRGQRENVGADRNNAHERC
ncbi:MAG TPA: hypothetical protein VES42_24810 [Pilimelia sp.]|nr:hypothetical protein [Pilimelia sp.]